VRSPETRYAVRPDGHLDLQWTDAALARFFERLASFWRLVIFDCRGAERA